MIKKKIKKRGQVETQTIIYIIGAIIGAFILFFGVKAVMSMNNSVGEAQLIEFEDKLTSTFISVKTSYGTVKQPEFKLHSKYTEICFVDVDTIDYSLITDDKYILLVDSVKDKDGNNIFLYEGNSLEVILSVPNIKISDTVSNINGLFCKKINGGMFGLTLEGLGDSVLVSE